MSKHAWRRVASVFSNLVDPLLLLPLILIWVIRGNLILLIVDIVMPGIALLYFMRERHFKDWDIRRRQQRVPLLLIFWLCQIAGIILARLLNLQQIYSYLLLIGLVFGIFLGVSLKWKISLHTGINSLFALLLMSLGFYGWWVVVILVGWARVVDKDHTIAQAVAGALVPPLVLLLLTWYI